MASKYFAVVLWITLLFLSSVDSDPDELDVGLRFTHEPGDVTATRSAPLWLNCDAESTSPQGGDVTIYWQKDGLDVSDPRHQVLANGTLFFKRVVHKKRGRTDSGEYQCFAKNNYGTIAGKKIKLQIAALGRFSGNPEALDVNAGELARLECSIEGSPTPSITWERNRLPLPQDKRYSSLPSGVLQISDARESDAGLFRCRANNDAKERQSSEAELTVSARANAPTSQLVAGPRDVTQLAGDDVTLECAVSYLPQDVSIKWSRPDGAQLAADRTSLLGQGNLRIKNVQLPDGGEYTCTAGDIQASARLVVHVPPTLQSVSESVAKPAASIQRFNCEFSGFPRPDITWTYNGVPIVTSGRLKLIHENEELLISNLVIEDSGIYQCWGRNVAGTVVGTARVYIEPSENAPGPPASVVAEPMGPTSIQIRWEETPSKNNHQTMAYTVHYVCVCSSEMGRKERQAVVQSTEAVVQELIPYTNYTFYIRAYNNMAASPPSLQITAMTSEDVPRVAPPVTVTPQGSTSLKVTWDDMTPEQARGKITQFKVMYRLKGSPSVQVIELGRASAREYIITDLEARKEYEVRVLAGTRQGFPSLEDRDNRNWPWVPQITDVRSKGVPDPPEFTDVKILNATAINLGWSDSKTVMPVGSETLGFKISYSKEGDAQNSISRLFVSSVLTHTLTSLEPDTKYEISLLSFNQLGDSEPSMITIQTPPVNGGPAPPPPPQHLEAEPINETAVKLSWHPPPFGTSVVDYTVKYSPVLSEAGREMTNANLDQFIRTGHTTLIVADLEPYTMYEFSVRSHTLDIAGVYSHTTWVRTEEGTPGAPTNPQWSLQGPRIVELRWNPPAEKNGVIRSYVILYSDEPDTPEVKWKVKSQNGNSTKATVNELRSNALYYFKLRATTSKGPGPPSRILEVQTNDNPTNTGRSGSPNDRQMGIIVGVCIGGACIIICAIIIILRNKCFPARPPPGDNLHDSSYHGNGCMLVVNGNGYLPGRQHEHSRLQTSSDFQEMDSFTPMLTRIPENEHSDSKGGGVPGYNGGNGTHINGYKSAPGNHGNHLRATYNSNGQVRTYLTTSDDGYSDSCEGSQIPLRCGSLDEEGRGDNHRDDLDDTMSVDEQEVSEDSGWNPHSRPLPPPPPPPQEAEAPGSGTETEGPARKDHDHAVAVPDATDVTSTSSSTPPPTVANAGARDPTEGNSRGRQQQQQQRHPPPSRGGDSTAQGNRAAPPHRHSQQARHNVPATSDVRHVPLTSDVLVHHQSEQCAVST